MRFAQGKHAHDRSAARALRQGVSWQPGGSIAVTKDTLPSVILSLLAAIVVMFFILILHFGKIGISILSLSVSVLCIFGATLGLWLFDLDLSLTAILGVISLIGIIVRNAIIMYDYAAELRSKNRVSVHEAAFEAGLRRMRPIFLTSSPEVAQPVMQFST